MQGMAWNNVRQNHYLITAMNQSFCTYTESGVNWGHSFVAVVVPWKIEDVVAIWIFFPTGRSSLCGWVRQGSFRENQRLIHLSLKKLLTTSLTLLPHRLCSLCSLNELLDILPNDSFPKDLLFSIDRNLLFCLSPEWYLFMESGWSFSISMSKFSVVNLVLCV